MKRLLLSMLFLGAVEVFGKTTTPRPFMTDRPDRTETPYSVPEGWFQVEADLVTFVPETDTASFAVANFKYGVTSDLDVQLILPGLVTRGGKQGFGALTVRVKQNLLGNDEGRFALGVMPFAQLPTGSGPAAGAPFLFGAMLPFSWEISRGFTLAGMAQGQLVKDAGGGFHPELVGTLVLGRDVIGPLWAYVEIYAQRNFGSAPATIVTLDGGIAYLLAPDWQLDLGANVGLTDAADALNPFLGLSVRW